MLTWPAATRLRPWKCIQERSGPGILKCSQKGLRTNWISRLKTRCSYSEQAALSATGHSETASLGKEGSYPWTCTRRKVPEGPSVAISKSRASCALSFCPPQPHPKSKEEMHGTKGQHAQRLPQQHILWSPHHSGAQWRASFVPLYWGTALETEDTPWTPTGRSRPEVTSHPPPLPLHGGQVSTDFRMFPKGRLPVLPWRVILMTQVIGFLFLALSIKTKLGKMGPVCILSF